MKLSILEAAALFCVAAVLFMIVGALVSRRLHISITLGTPAPIYLVPSGGGDDDDPDDGEFPPDDVPDPDDPVTVPDYPPADWVDDPLSRDRWPVRSREEHTGGRHRLTREGVS